MTDTRPLISVEQLKSYLNESPDYTNNDELYKMAVSVTTHMFELSTRRNFTEQEHTQYFTINKTSNRTLRVKNWPITDVAVYYKDVDNTYNVLTADIDYTINADLGEVYIINVPYYTGNNIRITYTSGYAPTDSLLVKNSADTTLTLGYTIPADIKFAALQHSSSIAKAMQTSACSDAKQKITAGANKGIYTNTVLAILAKYTRPIVII